MIGNVGVGDRDDGPELTIEPFVGFRSWRMREDPPALTGVLYSNWEWPPIEDAAAVCSAHPLGMSGAKRDKHLSANVPVKDCMCGLYGYDEYKLVQQTGWMGPESIARGVVIGWGKGWRHKRGWRTKFARPVGLLWWPDRHRMRIGGYGPKGPTAEDKKIGSHWNGVMLAIAKRYNVPVMSTVEELGATARSYA